MGDKEVEPDVIVVEPEPEPFVFPPYEFRLLDYSYDGEPFPLPQALETAGGAS